LKELDSECQIGRKYLHFCYNSTEKPNASDLFGRDADYGSALFAQLIWLFRFNWIVLFRVPAKSARARGITNTGDWWPNWLW